MAINQYRQHKEGDGWVYLQKQEPSQAADTGTMDPPHRHEAVVWGEKPAPFDEAATELEVVEGYVDLGLADDALQELASLPAGLGQTAQAVDLHIRALAIAGQMPQAAMVLDERARIILRRPVCCQKPRSSVANWLHENKQAGGRDQRVASAKQASRPTGDRHLAGGPCIAGTIRQVTHNLPGCVQAGLCLCSRLIFYGLAFFFQTSIVGWFLANGQHRTRPLLRSLRALLGRDACRRRHRCQPEASRARA